VVGPPVTDRGRSDAARADEPHAAPGSAGWRTLVPAPDERAAARVRLLPWAGAPGWWRAPLGLVAGLAAVRLLVGVLSPGVWFMNDSAEYVQLVGDLFVPRTRPPGVALFWRGVLGVWTSFDSIVVAHGLLGVLGGLVLFGIAREVGLRTRPALAAAVLGSCTPTVLFFERVVLTETLALFLLLMTTWLVLLAVRTRSTTAWALAGLVGGLSGMVRTVAVIALPVIAVIALLATRGSLLPRLAAVVAFALAAVVPLAGYAFAVYVDSRAVTGDGRFGLQFTDGYAYFAATAPLTDCTEPDRSPAIRARICAVPGYLDQDPDTIVWSGGPVNDALRSIRYIQRNDDLRALAFESIRRDPVGFLGTVGGRTVRMLSTYDNVHFTDASGVVAPYLGSVGLPTEQDPDRFETAWPFVLDVWVVARLAMWVGLASALAWAPRRWTRGGRELVIVAAVPVVSFLWLCITITAVARYLVVYEPVAWLAVLWLAQTVRDDTRARRAEAVRA